MNTNLRCLVIEIIITLLLGVFCITSLYASRNVNNASEKKKKVGAVFMAMNNPYFEVISEEICEVVENRGDIYTVRDSSLSTDTQLKQIKKLVDEGIDILLLNPVDWKSADREIDYANNRGVPVIVIDAPVYDDSRVSSTIRSDNRLCGRMCAEDLMKKREGAKILFLIQSSNKAAIDRIECFKETLDEAGWPYELVDEIECMGQLEITQPKVETLLQDDDRIPDVVMALNDPSALGAMAALDAKGLLDQVLVYGVDGAPEAKTMIYEGRMTATIAQSPIQTARKTVEVLYNILGGEEVEKEYIIPIDMISDRNIEGFSLSGWQ